MATTYTGAEVYQKIVDSLEFMKERMRTLDGAVQDFKSEDSRVQGEITSTRKDLAAAYVKMGNLEDATFRAQIQELTGVDLGYVVAEFDKREKEIHARALALEGDRFYLMRDAVKLAEGQEQDEDSPVFADARLNAILEIESHPGYMHEEGLLQSGFLSGKHGRGLFGFRTRRLRQLAEAVATDLGYGSWQEMEFGQAGDFSNLERRAGRREQRYSIPLLAINPSLTVLEVKQQVGKVTAEHDRLQNHLQSLQEEQFAYAVEQLAEQFGVLRLENLRDGSFAEVKVYITALQDLRGTVEETKRKIEATRAEQSALDKKIGQLTDTLSSSDLKNSSRSIDAKIVDKAFSGRLPTDPGALAELDRSIKRAFPQAVAYGNYGRTTTRPSRQEHDRVVREAGGVGKWTEWRKV